MRAFITAILLFLILIGTVTVNSVYINSSCDKIDLCARQIADTDDKEPLILELKQIWSKKLPIFNLSIRAGELERMSDLIASLEASYYAKNDAEIQKYCSLISDLAQDLAHYETLSFRSIF